MEKYAFLEHTADAKFQAFGKTLEEAFRNAALATASLMWNWEKIEKKIKYRVKIKGRDCKQLLCGFLEEIIYLLDTKGFLLRAVENLKIDKRGDCYLLKAIFKGDNYSDRYEIYGDVKAITYNEMMIENKGQFIIQVVVDI